MRVLYLHQHFTTPSGSGGTRSYEMARALVREGHAVTMVCGSSSLGATGLSGEFRGGKRRGLVDGIDVIECDLSYSNNLGFLARIRVFVRFALVALRVALSERYEIMVASSTPLTVGIPAVVANWVLGRRYVFEVRDLWPELPQAMGVIKNRVLLAMLSVLEWLSYRNADRCIALAPGIAKGILSRGIPEDRVIIVPNGCDIGLFQDVERKPWRPEGVGEDRLMAVFCGTHGKANGLDSLLDAAHALKLKKRYDIRIVLVGDGKFKEALFRRAASDALTNVVFHAPVSKNKLVGLLRSADVGIQCLANVEAFQYGTSPNKFFDYIASGLPVLINYPGWLANIINDEDCGIEVPPDDPDAIASALCKFADDRAKTELCGQNALSLAQRDFARDSLAQRWVKWVELAEDDSK